MSRSRKSSEPEYDVIGYTGNEDTGVVTGGILEERATGYKFTASVLETRQLVSEGKAYIPEYEDSDEEEDEDIDFEEYDD